MLPCILIDIFLLRYLARDTTLSSQALMSGTAERPPPILFDARYAFSLLRYVDVQDADLFKTSCPVPFLSFTPARSLYMIAFDANLALKYISTGISYQFCVLLYQRFSALDIIFH